MTKALTFSSFITNHLTEAQSDLSPVLDNIIDAAKDIAKAIDEGAVNGNMDNLASENVQGEVQKALDVITNDLFVAQCQKSGLVVGMGSEEVDDVIEVQVDGDPASKYLLLFDPLDGSSNVNVNISVGTIFSVLKTETNTPVLADYLQPGTEQVCAGYVLYGSSTMLVLTCGNGVNGFTLDQTSGEFLLTHPDMKIPTETHEFAANMSNYRLWHEPMQRYVDECLQGDEGPREKNFNMRWVASMVAEVHRILVRGGIFLYPMDSKIKSQGGKLRLMYEANPMSFIVEQAGGAATNGLKRIMNVTPKGIHQRVPVIMGSKSEVDLITAYFKGKK